MQNYINKQFAEKEHMYLVAWTYMSEVYENHMSNVAAIDGVSMRLKE
jgi:hypothetical protein